MRYLLDVLKNKLTPKNGVCKASQETPTHTCNSCFRSQRLLVQFSANKQPLFIKRLMATEQTELYSQSSLSWGWLQIVEGELQ